MTSLNTHLARVSLLGKASSALEIRIETMLPYLYKLALGLVGKTADAEDLVHDTCVKALTHGESTDLKTEGAFRAWMRVVLINQFRDTYRRQRNAPIHVESVEMYIVSGECSDRRQSIVYSPEESAVYRDLESATCAAIASLPGDLREVVTLYMFDDQSYREISAIVGCPIGTVMSRLSRGRKILRRDLQCYFISEPIDTDVSPETHKLQR